MDKLVFSFNDVPVILIIFQSFLFAILLLVARIGKRQANIFLAFFLMALGLDALDAMIYWSPSIKHVYLSDHVHIFYCLKFSVYLAAPTLYFYVKSLLYADFVFSRKDLLHFIPLALFPVLIAALYLSLGEEGRELGITQFGLLYSNPIYQVHLWVRNILYVGYGVACLLLLVRYKEELKQRYSNIENIDMFWLTMLVGGFLMIWFWVFISYLITLFSSSMWLGNVIGISGNVFNAIFVNALVVYSMAHVTIGYTLNPAEEKVEPGEHKEVDNIDPGIMEKLNQLMLERELFLDPDLTLEQLADITGISARKISSAINRTGKQNFFDYINNFRVKKAADILTNSNAKLSMLDVMADAGFNSKSTFYRAFKKITNMTPTEYQEQAGKQQP
ncbi:helix-turn-helix domain-containing protein [Cellvibrio fontiphilus]|uniref:Helix-turn-helix domain-containing protein n=1 Tax=Cellvibrio fontiphilus TaxID=1815559 RepID=A0ABV7F962_9GAMM